MIQLNIEGAYQYFGDYWNIVDTFDIIINMIFIDIKLNNRDRTRQYFAIIIVFLTMIKFLAQLRVFEDLGMLVLLIFQCVIDTIPFMQYLFIWIFFFFSLYRMLGAESGEPIEGLDSLLSNYINMFKTSVGDI